MKMFHSLQELPRIELGHIHFLKKKKRVEQSNFPHPSSIFLLRLKTQLRGTGAITENLFQYSLYGKSLTYVAFMAVFPILDPGSPIKLLLHDEKRLWLLLCKTAKIAKSTRTAHRQDNVPLNGQH